MKGVEHACVDGVGLVGGLQGPVAAVFDLLAGLGDLAVGADVHLEAGDRGDGGVGGIAAWDRVDVDVGRHVASVFEESGGMRWMYCECGGVEVVVILSASAMGVDGKNLWRKLRFCERVNRGKRGDDAHVNIDSMHGRL